MSKDLLDWENHEKHVAAIYQLLGYRVTPNININGQQTDLLCEMFVPGGGRVVLYVECKYTSNDKQSSVSKDTVTQFIANFHSLKQSLSWTTGVMVSNRKFTQYAQSAAAAHQDIVLKTIDDLYADLFQISAYLHACIRDYDADETFADYIPLKAVNQSRPALGAQYLEDLFDSWLQNSRNTQLCLLGDFGTGKTTFMRNIHYRCAKKFLAGESIRMPLYVQLRDYFDVRDGNELIERFFSLELATKVPRRIFDEFTKAGRFLLLLDGFDEMGVVSDSNSRRRNYLKLNQLIRPASKIVITCRPAYFVTYEELLDVFGPYKRQIGLTPPVTRGDKKTTAGFSNLSKQLKNASQEIKVRELLTAVGRHRKHTTIGTLELFDEEQISAYLATQREWIINNSNGQLDDKSLFREMGQIYDLEDLAKRPILLKLIVNTLPLFKKDEAGRYVVKATKQTFDDITPSVLYYTYTEGELTREYDKGEIRWQIDRDERRFLIGKLAFEMFEADVPGLEPLMLAAVVGSHFRSSGENLNQLATDIRTCSFLTLDRNNYLRFAHKSFLEYYVAQHLVTLIQTKRQAQEILGRRILPDEIFYFLGDLIRSFYPALLNIMRELTSSLEPTCRANALNILNYARHPRPFLNDIEAEGLSYLKLQMPTLEIHGSRIAAVRYVRSEIQKLTLNKTSIDSLMFQGGEINQLITIDSSFGLCDCSRTKLQMHLIRTTIRDFQLTNTLIEDTKCIESTVMMGPSFGSTVRNAEFHNTLIMSSVDNYPRPSKLENVLFDSCIFLYVDFDDALLMDATFRDCLFIRCYLEDGINLDRLEGSRGILQYKGHNKINGSPNEIKGRPFLWNSKRAEREITNLISINSPGKIPRTTSMGRYSSGCLSWCEEF